jgi:beta-phosphoglucomutase
MSMRELEETRLDDPQTLTAAIFDVDGVLLASPQEKAWREALIGFAEPARFTTTMYQAYVAGKPRLSGARALEALGVCRTPRGRPSPTRSASRSGSRN